MNGIDEFEEQLTDELREYLRIKMTWIQHDLCRIPLNLLLHNAEFATFPHLHRRMIVMANRALSLSVWMMNVGLNTHRNHGTWLGFRLCVRSALEVVAARKSANGYLVIPFDFESTARTMVQGLRYWEDEYPDVRRYLSILASLDDAFAE
ncbi:C6 zinc finger [Pestalotiopsis sp. IQ-011]